MQPALSPPTPRRAAPRRRLDLLVTFLSLVVAVELTWFLVHTPVRLVTEGQADVVLQGDKAIDGEQSGQLIPGPQPPHMAHGEGRDAEAPPVPGFPVPGKDGDMAGGGAPAAFRVGTAKVPQPPRPPGDRDGDGGHGGAATDDYHRTLVGIILLDGQHPLDKAQARRLLDAIRAREALNGNDVAEAAHTVLDVLSPAQRAFLTHARDDRMRQKRPPSAPEELPRQISRWLEMTEQ